MKKILTLLVLPIMCVSTVYGATSKPDSEDGAGAGTAPVSTLSAPDTMDALLGDDFMAQWNDTERQYRLLGPLCSQTLHEVMTKGEIREKPLDQQDLVRGALKDFWEILARKVPHLLACDEIPTAGQTGLYDVFAPVFREVDPSFVSLLSREAKHQTLSLHFTRTAGFVFDQYGTSLTQDNVMGAVVLQWWVDVLKESAGGPWLKQYGSAPRWEIQLIMTSDAFRRQGFRSDALTGVDVSGEFDTALKDWLVSGGPIAPVINKVSTAVAVWFHGLGKEESTERGATVSDEDTVEALKDAAETLKRRAFMASSEIPSDREGLLAALNEYASKMAGSYTTY